MGGMGIARGCDARTLSVALMRTCTCVAFWFICSICVLFITEPVEFERHTVDHVTVFGVAVVSKTPVVHSIAVVTLMISSVNPEYAGGLAGRLGLAATVIVRFADANEPGIAGEAGGVEPVTTV